MRIENESQRQTALCEMKQIQDRSASGDTLKEDGARRNEIAIELCQYEMKLQNCEILKIN
jgi:hypothetical protein